MKRPSILTGAIIGGVLMIPLLAVAYLGYAAAALPFPAFDVFNWLPNVLPGEVTTFGIDTIVNTIRTLNLGPTDDTAKTAEQLMGIGIIIVVGVIAGGLFTALMHRLVEKRTESIPGIILGAIVALPFILFSFAVNFTTQADPLPSIVWLFGLFILWGAAMSFIYNTLRFRTKASPETPATVQVVDRRSFLVTVGTATAVVTVIGAGVSTLIARRQEDAIVPSAATEPEGNLAEEIAQLPNAGDPVEPAPGTRPEVTPLNQHYRIDIRSDPNGLVIPAEGYTLPFTSAIDGESTTIAEFTLEDIRNNFEAVDEYITMSCISNRLGGDLISTIKWTGARMQDVLASMDVPENATHLWITSGDGFDESLSIEMINNDPRILLAYAWADQPLTSRHGFPLRVHIPNHYGMKQPKWITGIEFINGDQPGYWVRRGWDEQAIVRATSVIDTVATNMVITEGENILIPVGGMAWAGDRGISRVEVRVDGGEWVEAQLRAPISDRTWQLWRYNWPFSEGQHVFEVRCFEGDGEMQILESNPVRPSGATGTHSMRANV